MEIVTATPALVEYVSRVVSLQMAECLAAAEVDLSDLDAVVTTLGRHNFGSASVAHCVDRALEFAGKGK